MDVRLNEDEQAIKSAAADFLAEQSTMQVVRAAEASDRKYAPELWQRVSELGWCGLCLPEEVGGQAAPLTWLGLMLEEVGRHLAPIPLATSSAAALTIARFGNATQRGRLSAVASGERILAHALQEQAGAWSVDSTATVASVEGGEIVLNGTKSFVDGASAADQLLVSVRNAKDGVIGLCLLDLGTPGVSVRRLVNTAKADQSIVVLDGVRLSAEALVGGWGKGREAVSYLMALATAFATAQMAGATRRVTEMAVEYSRIRFAFGQPIGSFQSLQHLAADMIIAVDGSELLLREALWRLDNGLSHEVEISQAKAFSSIHCVSSCRSGQQIHGGMGFMMEFDVNLFYRRVVSWSLCAGTAYEHRRVVSKHLLGQSERLRLDDCHPAERSAVRTLAA